jgi:hypothetical protein
MAPQYMSAEFWTETRRGWRRRLPPLTEKASHHSAPERVGWLKKQDNDACYERPPD